MTIPTNLTILKTKFIDEIKKVNWLCIFSFYGIILFLTYFSRKLPNILQSVIHSLTDVEVNWNYNHGIAIFIISFLFYRFSTIKSTYSLLGNNKLRSLLFPIILLVTYSIYGISNQHGINEHLWAFIFCLFTLLYDLMEEYTWRGYLIESLGKIQVLIKGVIAGIFWGFWHLLIFNNFDQYGGFGVFLAFSIIFSLILTFSVSKTKAFIIPATIHALLIRTNMVTLICFILFALILLTWNKKLFNNKDLKL